MTVPSFAPFKRLMTFDLPPNPMPAGPGRGEVRVSFIALELAGYDRVGGHLQMVRQCDDQRARHDDANRRIAALMAHLHHIEGFIAPFDRAEIDLSVGPYLDRVHISLSPYGASIRALVDLRGAAAPQGVA